MSLLHRASSSMRRCRQSNRGRKAISRPLPIIELLEERAVPSVSTIAHDLTGNAYLAGQFSGQTSLNTGSGQTTLTATGTQDVFLAKYNSAGTPAWTESLPGSGTSTATASAVVVDSSGYVLVTGSFSGT